MSIQQFCLRWNNHQPNFISVFTALLNSESLVDVTLAAEGKHLQAHKVVLSACSVYFQTLFTANPSRHPIVILKDVKYADLRIMVDFMYYGEVNVSQEQLPQILETAKMLKIKGLTEMPDSTSLTKSQSSSSGENMMPGDSSWESQRHSLSPGNMSPTIRRKRLRKASTGSASISLERNTEDKCVETTHMGSSVNLAKTDCITMSNLAQARRKDSFQEYKDPEENGMETNMHQSTEESGNCMMRTVEPINDQTTTNLTQQGKSKSNLRGKLLIRQQRVKKDSESATPEEEATTSSLLLPQIFLTRQNSSPIPLRIKPTAPELLTVRKQMSQPANTVKVSGTVTPILLSSVMLQPTEIKSEINVIAAKNEQESVISEPEIVPPPPSVSDLQPETTEVTPDIYESQRSSHCPAIRTGPALSCNFCWNTVDDQGRILRRKTKYHCPECQTNLCIVPCFQEYHESHPH